MKPLRLTLIFFAILSSLTITTPAFAISNDSSRFNTSNLTCQGGNSDYDALLAVTFTSSLNGGYRLAGQLTNSCSYDSQTHSVQHTNPYKYFITDKPADGFNILIQITTNPITSCNNHYNTQENVPFKIECTASNGADVIVLITTNVPTTGQPPTG